MDELVKLVQQKTGLPEGQAKAAVVTVIDYLKGRLPAPLAAQVDAVLSGKAPDIGALGGLLGEK